MEKLCVKDDSENNSKARSCRSVQGHPISAEDESRLHQLGKKVFARNIPSDIALIAGLFWKGAILVADIEELGIRRVRNPRSKARRKRNIKV